MPEILAAEPVPVAQEPIQLEAAEILARTAEAYRSATTLRDEGYVRTVDVHDGDPEVSSLEHYRVPLERPHRFLWQWSDQKSNRTAVDSFTTLLQRDTGLEFTSDLHDGSHRAANLREALAVTNSGASERLLRLLHPEAVSGSAPTEISGARLAGIERVNGYDCFRIDGNVEPATSSATDTTTWWIDCDSFLVRRSFLRAHLETFVLERTFASTPEAGVPLQPADLALDASF